MAYRKKDRVIRQQPDRRANRTILIRTLILMGIFGLAVFVPLFFRLWQIQIDEYDKYRELVADQQTKDSTVEALSLIHIWTMPLRLRSRCSAVFCGGGCASAAGRITGFGCSRHCCSRWATPTMWEAAIFPLSLRCR